MKRFALVAVAVIAMVLPLAGTATAQQLGVDPTLSKTTLYNQLVTPTAMDIAPDGRVVIGSREGQVTVWEQDGSVTPAAKIPVDAYDRQGGQYDLGNCPRGERCPEAFNLAEGGIHGVLLAPDFMESGEVYIYYTVPNSLGDDLWPPKMPNARPFCDPSAGSGCDLPPQAPRDANGSDEGKFRLSRFTMDLATNELSLASELPLFENPAEWYYCCHYGGDIQWKNDGTLLMTTGDDTTSDESNGYSPHDTRADKTYNSAVLTSQNKADRRGKVLRIDVADIEAGGDGIPGDGEAPNPFADDPDADPYVYALGFRSNYRFAYNAETDHLYVGTVGPDARNANAARGPAAHDEIEVVPPGGGTNHGWPLCIANNLPYNRYDFETGTAGAPFSCAGMTPASIYYTYQPSATSPYIQMGQGSNTVMGGTAYLRPDTGALRLPAAYDQQLLWMEHGRGQLWRSPIRPDGSLDNSPTSLMPVATGGLFIANTLSNPIDSLVGPDGALYVLEGVGFWNSTSGRLTRITCAGCQPNSADYGGAAVASAPSTLAVASIDGGLLSQAPAWAILALAVSAAGLVALRRRREVI